MKLRHVTVTNGFGQSIYGKTLDVICISLTSSTCYKNDSGSFSNHIFA